MDISAIEEALLELAHHAGVKVRRERFDPGVFGQAGQRGGLCVIGGQHVILVDSQLSPVERVGVLSDALAGLDLEFVAVAPAVRERLALSAYRRALRAKQQRPRLRRVI